MHQLSEALRAHADVADSSFSGEPDEPLEAAAKAWAMFALQTHNGPLLRKALEISAGMIDYVDEFKAALKGK